MNIVSDSLCLLVFVELYFMARQSLEHICDFNWLLVSIDFMGWCVSYCVLWFWLFFDCICVNLCL